MTTDSTVTAPATGGISAPIQAKSTVKRDTLIENEKKWQQYWKETKANEVNAPENTPIDGTLEEIAAFREQNPKFVATMAYPYMNLRLHLGHTFTASKAEFATRFERLRGKTATFPFGFHCTGMPIKAAADKIVDEVAKFGPQFERFEEVIAAEQLQNLNVADKKDDKKPAVKSKVAAKTGNYKYQFQILQSAGVPKEEIHKFVDPMHWLSYFPDHCINDMSEVGLSTDWRRSFITTDANPFYDSFIRWQFVRLKEKDYVKFGKRETIFSPKDNQPCMDHDRSKGEAVQPTDFTAIKMRVIEFSPAAAASVAAASDVLAGKTLYMVAATKRPETMYGQTNCFVGPSITYSFYVGSNPDEVYIITEHAARNMAYQEQLAEFAKYPALHSIEGKDLIGTRVNAPNSVHSNGVYVLPLASVSPTMGTGVVTSVPSDAPTDFAAHADLCKKPDFYGIKPEWIQPFSPVPIIAIPEFPSGMCAPELCAKFKVASPKDLDALEKAKDEAYKAGFYRGTMTVGGPGIEGKPVAEAKPLVQKQMIDAGNAFQYYEPESEVVSRSGDTCVVAALNQWYLNYGEKHWLAQAHQVLDQMNLFHPEPRAVMSNTLDIIHQWACARQRGLGTRLPWDEEAIIEPLSDSTIYMAYYTIAHLLHGGTLDGSGESPEGIKPEHMTMAVWDYVFGGKSMPTAEDTPIPPETLRKLRREFVYFYPLDLRCSGKDLLLNHLLFFVYNHATMFGAENWPKAINSNGHLTLNNAKMSKSTGNFITAYEATAKYGADAMRLALADAGDSPINDANFEEATANAAILRLYGQLEWVAEVLGEGASQLRTGELNFQDRVFEQEMISLLHSAYAAYEIMQFRDALKYGFFEFQSARDRYREVTSLSGEGMHAGLIRTFIEWQAVLMAPITPHWSEQIWSGLLNKSETVLKARWPSTLQHAGNAPIPAHVDAAILAADEYIRKTVRRVREMETQMAKKAAAGKKKGAAAPAPEPAAAAAGPKSVTIVIMDEFPEWQNVTIDALRNNYDAQTRTFDDKKMREEVAKKGFAKEKKVMPFANEIKKQVQNPTIGEKAFNRALLFDEHDVLTTARVYMQKTLGFAEVTIVKADAELRAKSAEDKEVARAIDMGLPGEPGFIIA
ncbi:putative leucine--tRNA ligase, cytoplasmic [Ramicandelaber brevisporus]|nr:putative leucine--tRNA ligase, cytoplasmic [Ramicandelaber brevisporus]